MIINILMNGCEFDIDPGLYTAKLEKAFYRIDSTAFGVSGISPGVVYPVYIICIFFIGLLIYKKDTNNEKWYLFGILFFIAFIAFFAGIHGYYDANIGNKTGETLFRLNGQSYIDNAYDDFIETWKDNRKNLYAAFGTISVICTLIFFFGLKDKASDVYGSLKGQFQTRYELYGLTENFESSNVGTLYYISGAIGAIFLVLTLYIYIFEVLMFNQNFNTESYQFRYIIHILDDDGAGNVRFYIRGLDNNSNDYSYHRDGQNKISSDHRSQILKEVYGVKSLTKFKFNETDSEITTSDGDFIKEIIPNYGVPELVYQPNGEKAYTIPTTGGKYTSIWVLPVYKDGTKLNTPHEKVYNILKTDVGEQVANEIIKAFKYTINDKKVHYLTLTNDSTVSTTAYDELNKKYNETITKDLYKIVLNVPDTTSLESFKNMELYILDPTKITLTGVYDNTGNKIKERLKTTNDQFRFKISDSAPTPVEEVYVLTTNTSNITASEFLLKQPNLIKVPIKFDDIVKNTIYFATTDKDFIGIGDKEKQLIIKIPKQNSSTLPIFMTTVIDTDIQLYSYNDTTTPILNNDYIEIIDFDIPAT